MSLRTIVQIARITRPVPMVTDSFRFNTNLRIRDSKERALEMATAHGFKNHVISESFDLDVYNTFAEYPMSLTGPGAPKFNSWEDVLHFGNCKYTVTVREKY